MAQIADRRAQLANNATAVFITLSAGGLAAALTWMQSLPLEPDQLSCNSVLLTRMPWVCGLLLCGLLSAAASPALTLELAAFRTSADLAITTGREARAPTALLVERECFRASSPNLQYEFRCLAVSTLNPGSDCDAHQLWASHRRADIGMSCISRKQDIYPTAGGGESADIVLPPSTGHGDVIVANQICALDPRCVWRSIRSECEHGHRDGIEQVGKKGHVEVCLPRSLRNPIVESWSP